MPIKSNVEAVKDLQKKNTELNNTITLGLKVQTKLKDEIDGLNITLHNKIKKINKLTDDLQTSKAHYVDLSQALNTINNLSRNPYR